MKNCLNCDSPISLEHKHCSQCGQKTRLSKLRFAILVKDFLSNLFNIENKIWSSLKGIWSPAKLTKAFVSGRRIAYYHPLRLFLVVLFGFFTLVLTQLRDTLSTLSEVSAIQERNIWIGHYISNYDTLALEHEVLRDTVLNLKYKIFKKKVEVSVEEKDSIEIQSSVQDGWDSYPESNDSLPNTDTIKNLELDKEETAKDKELYYGGGEWNGVITGDIKASDFFRMSSDELKQKHGKGVWYKELFVVQTQKILKDLQSSVSFFIGNGTWAIVLMVLLMSAVFYLLYLRGVYHFAEHFILQVNAHTRMMVLASILIVISKVIPESADYLWLLYGWFIVSILYMYKSLRSYYQQSRLKTVFKMIISLGFYVLIISACLLFILLLSGALL